MLMTPTSVFSLSIGTSTAGRAPPSVDGPARCGFGGVIGGVAQLLRPPDAIKQAPGYWLKRATLLP